MNRFSTHVAQMNVEMGFARDSRRAGSAQAPSSRAFLGCQNGKSRFETICLCGNGLIG
jgi:hypothetical protein